MIDKIEKLEFGDLITEQISKQSEYEVDEKGGVHIILSDGKETLADFYLGKVIDDFTTFRLSKSSQIYQAVSSLRYIFERELKNWRNRTILEFKQEDVRSLEIKTGDESIHLTRPDEKTAWKVEGTTTE